MNISVNTKNTYKCKYSHKYEYKCKYKYKSQ